MNTIKMVRSTVLAATTLLIGTAQAQVTIDNNNPPNGSYVGHSAGNGNPVEVRHNANHPISWFTNATHRMMLNASPAGATINGYTGITRDGFLGLSARPDFFNPLLNPGPFTRLHLVDDQGTNDPVVYAQQFGFRPWMRNGITFTGNSDQSYIGQQYISDDATDMVIQWSDNPSTDPWASDRLRIVFASGTNPPAATGMRSLNGLEAMRFWPADPDNVNVGIGDWLVPGSGDPTERLDLLTGRLRIRQLPNDPDTDDDKVMVVDDDGVVHWRPFADFAGQTDCDWNQLPTGPLHVRTAYPGALAGCPNDASGVGIGLVTPQAKLHVNATQSSTNHAFGLRTVFDVEDNGSAVGLSVLVQPEVVGDRAAIQAGAGITSNNADINTGLRIDVTQNDPAAIATSNTGLDINATCADGDVNESVGLDVASTQTGGDISLNYGTISHAIGARSRAFGGHFFSKDAPTNYGLWCGTSDADATINYGVKSEAKYGATAYGVHSIATTAGTNYGIWAQAVGGSANWAGWYEGDVMINGNGFLTGMVPITSDANLKTNVQDLNNGLQLIEQLEPKTYDFMVNDFPSINLSSIPQIGLIAQDVEQILPDLVSDVTIPAELDSTGSVIHPQEEIKALNYIGLIPVLIAAVKDQQTIIDQQNQRLDQFEQDLAQCCISLDGVGMRTQEQGLENDAPGTGNDQLKIHPNPFTENTTIGYSLKQAGKMQLQVASSAGKVLSILQEGWRDAGEHTYQWNTSDLAPGLYYLTLLQDGKPLMEKVVKVR